MADSTYPSDSQLAGLVEAATAAAGQETEWSQNNGATGSGHRCLGGAGTNSLACTPYKSLLSGQYDPGLRRMCNAGESDVLARPGTRKRKRGDSSVDVGDDLAAEQAADAPSSQHSPINRTSTNLHSAAALFRAPSRSSRQYARPLMSKLYSSLQLLPADFLHLQSAAKAYMLDDEHPERRDCVGQRGKTDSDMVKLKLWGCVQEFLVQGDNGEKFFGVEAPKVARENGARGMTWPEDAQQIIKACLPLLRRMVTNERQRQYAVETRKGGGDGKRQGHGRYAQQLRQRTPPTTIDGIDSPDTATSDRIDIFGDGLIPVADEASEWYDNYNSAGDLDKIFIQSKFPSVLLIPVITNIDGHCRLYHGNAIAQCGESCQRRLVGKLLALPAYQKPAPAGDLLETVQTVFKTILTHLTRVRYWKCHDAEHTATSAAPSTAPVRHVSSTNPPSSWKNATARSTGAGGPPNGETLTRSTRLLIYIVRQNKSVLPSFDIPSEKCPNLAALRMQIQNHYSLATLQEKRVRSLTGAPFKIWLPDGLMRVEDDGQWMVALLTVDTVEWMGGQIRVLLET